MSKNLPKILHSWRIISSHDEYQRTYKVLSKQRCRYNSEPQAINPDTNTIINIVRPDQCELALSPLAHGLIVFKENDQYFALLNIDKDGKYPNLVGGGASGEESHIQTFRRETLEETGFIVNPQEALTLLIFDSIKYGLSACPLYLIDATNLSPNEAQSQLDSQSIAIVNLGWLIEQLPSAVRTPIRDRIADALHLLGSRDPEQV